MRRHPQHPPLGQRTRGAGWHCAAMAERFDLHAPALRELLARQDGVIARWQLVALGAQPHDIERLLRRRDLCCPHPGVYVDHTGPLTPRQRDWVAVLAAWPAGLTGPSALPGPRPARVHIAIERGRTIQVPDGVVAHRTSGLQQRVNWQRSPPRMRLEHATIDEMSAQLRDAGVASAFTCLARVVQSRQTTAARILETLATRKRVAGRQLIAGMLIDVRDGMCSVLERGYRDNVERPHGLPRPRRQRVSLATGATTYQDLRYEPYSFVVELDGYAFHGDAAARDADADRDLAELATSGAPTARVTYGLVFDTPCRTAGWIGEILRNRGWSGVPTECPACGASGLRRCAPLVPAASAAHR